MGSAGKCPFTDGTPARTNRDWWPNELDLQVLHQHASLCDPMGEALDSAREFRGLDKTFGFGGGDKVPGSPQQTSTGAPKASGWPTALHRRPRSPNSVRRRADGLIHVNPEGPNGKPAPLGRAPTALASA